MIENYIYRYKRHLAARSPIPLLVELTILSFVVKFIPGLVLGFFLSDQLQTTTDVQAATNSEIEMLFLAVIAAPPLETVIGQWLPVFVVSFFTRKVLSPLLISALFFGLLHLYAGWASVFIIFFPGLVFSLCFLAQQDRSIWRAYWTTTVLHAIHNLISLTVYFIVL